MSQQQILGKRLEAIGFFGLAAALVVAVSGLLLASRVSDTATATFVPFVGISNDIVDAIDATGLMVERTTEAIVSIENATRSTARALTSVSEAIGGAGDLVGTDIADSLDAAVDTLPGLVSTAGVIDTTMRALSFVGVDYDPEIPLDDALAALERSLEPIPDQLRSQVAALGIVTTDLTQIAADSGELAAVLLGARIDMISAQEVLESAAANAREAVDQIEQIESDIDTYGLLIRIGFLAAAIALATVASAPILVGRHYLRHDEVGLVSSR